MDSKTLDAAFAEEEARQRSEHAGNTWVPDPEDRLVGTIVGIEQVDGDYGPYPLLHIDCGDDEVTVLHAFHQVLRAELTRLKAKVGDKVAIKYRGKPAKAHLYSVLRLGEAADAGPANDADAAVF